MNLFVHDIPYLPLQVHVSESQVTDDSSNESYPINSSSYWMLHYVDGRRSIGEIATKVAKQYDADEQRITLDTIRFFEQLNGHFLLNIRVRSWKDRLQTAWFLFRTLQIGSLFQLMKIKKRYNLPAYTRNPIFLLIYLIFFIPFYYIYILAGMFLLYYALGMGWSAFVFTFNIFVSIAVHEFSHVMGLHLVKQPHAFLFIGRNNYTVGLYRERLTPAKEVVVSLLGPIVPALIGVILLVFAYKQSDSELFYLAVVWLGNLLTLLSTDGKNVARAALSWFRRNQLGRQVDKEESL
ncbi:PqqD family peptide modification chaperone [Paenibacillus sp. YYML68]|uniref:PqqD family peptide modification chaperone n=1 Tax=Paenibacillus sp. YYML68 TaxID=2909250 RepID=UPI002490515D|nr:PqqD family peptide modification chaperone [Paenibacillus sp. YYML68]